MNSWKTTLGGILYCVGTGLERNPHTAPYADTVKAIGVGILALAARDNNVTSEQAGASAPKPPGPPVVGLLLIASLLFATGCHTTPLDASAKVLTSTVQTVDSAMTGYAQLVALGQVSVPSQAQARKLYGEYQAAEAIAEASILAAVKTGDTSGLAKSEAALNAAKLPLLQFLSLLTTSPPK